MGPRLTRRAWLGGAASLGMTRHAFAAEPPLTARDVQLAGRRALLVAPRGVNGPMPLAVLLHGLGETGAARAGAYAFWERYGLPSAYARLLAPPVVRTSAAGYFTDAALLRVNEKLRERPFGPLAFLCPHVPNLQSPVQVAPVAAWLVDKALPAARAHFSDAGAPVEKVLLAGCSLGAFIAFETLLAAPQAFVAVAGVQSAIGVSSAPRYAAAFAKAGLAGSRVYLSTSSGDPYLQPTRSLGAALRAQGIAPEMHEAPGPHDQPWLREVGTVELILALHRAAARA